MPTRALTNDYNDCKLIKLDSNDPKSPLVVMQEGYAPSDATCRMRMFYLQRDGFWIDEIARSTLPDSEKLATLCLKPRRKRSGRCPAFSASRSFANCCQSSRHTGLHDPRARRFHPRNFSASSWHATAAAERDNAMSMMKIRWMEITLTGGKRLKFKFPVQATEENAAQRMEEALKLPTVSISADGKLYVISNIQHSDNHDFSRNHETSAQRHSRRDHVLDHKQTTPNEIQSHYSSRDFRAPRRVRHTCCPGTMLVLTAATTVSITPPTASMRVTTTAMTVAPTAMIGSIGGTVTSHTSAPANIFRLG
jgi:hypothetical protein